MGRIGAGLRTGFGVAVATALVAGCSTPHIAQRYAVNAPVRQIVLSCRDVYEVYDRADAETLLVTTSVGTEASARICGGNMSLAERMRAAADRYFVEVTKPPTCRILGGEELTPAHWEFHYRCVTPARVNPAVRAGPPRP